MPPVHVRLHPLAKGGPFGLGHEGRESFSVRQGPTPRNVPHRSARLYINRVLLSDIWRDVAGLTGGEDLEARLIALLAQAKGACPRAFARTTPVSSAIWRSAHAPPRRQRPSSGARTFGDLYLAHACISRDPAALRRFRRALRREIRMARVASAPEAADEIGQRVREKLFVQGRLDAYTGTGPLGACFARWWPARPSSGSGWSPTAPCLERPRARSSGRPPRSRARAASCRVHGCLQEGLSRRPRLLDAHERTILRLSVIERLTADQIARADGAHRVTVARRLGAIRDKLLASTPRCSSSALASPRRSSARSRASV